MLARHQAPRLLAHRLHLSPSTPHAAPPWRRANSTAARAHERTPREDVRLKLPGSRSAFIRAWTFPESPADAFAIIRAVERKYGPITEYRFARDFEMGHYQLIVHVTFRDRESFERISTDADVLHIPAPVTIADRPGGLGLDELEGLLARQERTDDEAAPTALPAFDTVMNGVLEEEAKGKPRMIDLRVQRSYNEYFTPSTVPAGGPPRGTREATARNFINWGGFHELVPIASDTPIPNEALFASNTSTGTSTNADTNSTLDHVRMRRTLRRYSETTGLPNPYEYKPGFAPVPRRKEDSQVISGSNPAERKEGEVAAAGETEAEAKTTERAEKATLEWEPLPGSEGLVEDVPMPSNMGVSRQKQQQTRSVPASASTSTSTSAPSYTAPTPTPPPIEPDTITAATEAPPTAATEPPTPAAQQQQPQKNPAPSRPHSQLPPQTQKPAEWTAQIRAARKLAKQAEHEQRQKQAQKRPQQQQQQKAKPPAVNAERKKEPAFLEPPEEPVVVERKDEGISKRLKGFVGGWF